MAIVQHPHEAVVYLVVAVYQVLHEMLADVKVHKNVKGIVTSIGNWLVVHAVSIIVVLKIPIVTVYDSLLEAPP